MDGFTYYKSFVEAVEGLPDTKRAKFCLAIVEFCHYDIEPELPADLKRLFVLVRLTLEKSKKRSKVGLS